VQTVQRAGDPLLRRFLAEFERDSNFSRRLLLEKPEEDDGPVCFGQFIQGSVQHGSHSIPVRFGF
jgi:hypothetical protein